MIGRSGPSMLPNINMPDTVEVDPYRLDGWGGPPRHAAGRDGRGGPGRAGDVAGGMGLPASWRVDRARARRIGRDGTPARRDGGRVREVEFDRRADRIDPDLTGLMSGRPPP